MLAYVLPDRGDKSGHTHDDTHCIDLDRSMHHNVSSGCDEDIHLVLAKRAKTTDVSSG
jgi:hypothetical protein